MLPPHRPVAATRPARAHTAHNIPQIYEEIPRNETKGPDLLRNRRAAERPRGDFPAFFLESAENFLLLPAHEGGLAQLARALAWHARGHEFDSRILHYCEQGVAKYCDPLFFSFLQTIRTRIDNHTTLNRKYNPHGSWRSRSVSSGWRAPSSPSRTRRISPPL